MTSTERNSEQRRSGKWPSGFRLRQTIRRHVGWISRIAWSPDGRLLASASDDNTIIITDVTSGAIRTLKGHDDTVFSVAWSESARFLASGSDDETIIWWDVESGQPLKILTGHTSGVVCVCWLPGEEVLVSGSGDRTIRLWSLQTGEVVRQIDAHSGWVRDMALLPSCGLVASASYDKTIKIWRLDDLECLRTLEGHTDGVHGLAWSPDGQLIASASKDMTVRIWHAHEGRPLRVLEGHTAPVYSVAYSSDGLVLASKGLDSSVRLWNCSTWGLAETLHEESSTTFFGTLAFHPSELVLATLGERDEVIRIWDVDRSALLAGSARVKSLHYASAKVVLVGESNVGKSCLAMRLAEDRYAEQGTTHGMRFWDLNLLQLDPNSTSPEDESREVIIWDMGGQEEYRLIHQLFLHDTTLALILLDPTRGKAAFEDVEAWNRRLEKQLHGRKAVKLLVGTKLDDPSAVIDRPGLERLIAECGFVGFLETSARTGRGLDELRGAIAQNIDWDLLAKTSRPEFFQRIRTGIEEARDRGEVVLLFTDLANRLGKGEASADHEAIETVVEQLAIQGLIADTQLGSGERALVLQVAEIERYGGSLILAARNNPRGVPAVEERTIASRSMIFPRITPAERLPWLQERVVLECVVELFLKHGISLRHEGLLIFPSLFVATERSERSDPQFSISLYYDFTGAIDNVYSSLVAKLSLSERFGRYRLWESRAEFEALDQGICGLRKVTYRTGVAHLDLYFSDEVDKGRRDLFLVFVEDHLRTEGVDITENVELVCACGFRFPEQAVRTRLAVGLGDILCPVCEKRNQISEGARQARVNNSSLENNLIALKTVIDHNAQVHVERAKGILRSPERSHGVIRILHLSDLHMSSTDSHPATMLEELIADLRDKGGGLGFDRLDYLLVSGDLSTRALPVEFEKAYELVHGLIDYFGLTAERCIIVPGNHDLNWDEPVYNWRSRRQVDLRKLQEDSYVEQGTVVLIRDEQRYPLRLRNFNDNFYKFLTQQEYPLNAEEQCTPFLFVDAAIQVLAVNSCWEIDEFNTTRASIHAGALMRGLREAEKQIQVAVNERVLSADRQVLRLAVWHHPVTGNDKIQDDAFLEHLRKAGFRLCLHGHVHEDRSEIVGYTHARKLYVAGAGAFGAPAHDRPEAVPRLYNVLEIKRDHSEITIHTRCKRKDTGAWEGWAVWDGADPVAKLTYYRIKLRN